MTDEPEYRLKATPQAAAKCFRELMGERNAKLWGKQFIADVDMSWADQEVFLEELARLSR